MRGSAQAGARAAASAGEDAGPERWIGVDGGGSRSRAMVVDAAGRELSRVEGGSALIDLLRPLEAARVVAELAGTAATAAGAELPVRGLWAGLAGAGPLGPRAAVRDFLAEEGVAAAVAVGGDVEAARADAFGDGPGILLVVGTGSVAVGRDPAGVEATAGGWGAALDDEGSGYRIGLDGLRAVMRSADGRAPATSLTGAMLRETGVADPRDLVEWAASATKRDVAALCVAVGRACQEGDAAAAQVVEKALAGIRSLVGAVLARTSGWPGKPPLAMIGGVVREGSEMRAPVMRVVAEQGCAVRRAPVIAERGAARKAIRLFPPSS